MRIGYAKIGRAWDPRVSHASTVGGDIDVIRGFQRLRAARPGDQYVMVGKTRVDPREVFGQEVRAPWYENEALVNVRRGSVDEQMDAMEPYARQLDALVVWLGQIGGAATPLPKIDGSGPITPLQMDTNYAAYLCRLVNVWRELHPDRDVIWLVPDCRNRLALHDFRDPPKEPLLAQYDMTRNGVHYAPLPGEPNRFIRAVHTFKYGAVELCAVPARSSWINGSPVAFRDRVPFGIVANENKRGKLNRAEILKEWIGDLDRIPLYGSWSEDGLAELGRTEPVEPLPYERLYTELARWKITMTMPASGSGWATSKPWEMFAAGVVCLFHPAYDDQGHIIAVDPADAETKNEAFLSVMLRPKTPEEFRARINALSNDEKLFNMVVGAQYYHLHARFLKEAGGVRSTIDRLERYDR